MRIELAREKCRGRGLCLLAAPELFDLDDDGVSTLVGTPDRPELVAQAETAAHDCPEGVISLVN